MSIYKKFLDLLPKQPLQIGLVTSVTGGVATLTLPDGGTTQARGEATVGQRVYFRGGAIEGQAPTLPLEVIDL